MILKNSHREKKSYKHSKAGLAEHFKGQITTAFGLLLGWTFGIDVRKKFDTFLNFEKAEKRVLPYRSHEEILLTHLFLIGIL
jgi:hypothetical protein